MQVICLIGLNNSGKSTAGEIVAQLLNKRGYRVEVRPLARPLKLLANKYCNINKHEDRFKLEEFAEELKFLFGTEIFVKIAMSNVSDLDFIVIPDLRFFEEYRFLLLNSNKTHVIEIARQSETSPDDVYRLETLKSFGIATIAAVDVPREELVRTLDGLVSQIVEEKT